MPPSIVVAMSDVTKDGREFETVDALVAEIYADIVEDFEMGLEYFEE